MVKYVFNNFRKKNLLNKIINQTNNNRNKVVILFRGFFKWTRSL